jgi:hypothetical protein
MKEIGEAISVIEQNFNDPGVRDSVFKIIHRWRGRLGGSAGGPARAKKLSPRRRKEIAKTGGLARQARHRELMGDAAELPKESMLVLT